MIILILKKKPTTNENGFFYLITRDINIQIYSFKRQGNFREMGWNGG